MSILITAIMVSETINLQTLLFNGVNPIDKLQLKDYIYEDLPYNAIRDLSYWDIYTPRGLQLIKFILNGQILEAQNYLKTFFEEIYIDALINITTDELDEPEIIKIIATESKSKKRFQNPQNPHSWISRRTLIKKYNLRGFVMNNPYINFENNDSHENCVYNYAKQRYPKISKKEIERFNKTNVNIDEIELFCNKYKIACHLFNVAGREIYTNGLVNSTKKNFVGMITNNHFYPKIYKSNTYTPQQNKTESELKNIDYKKDIIIQTNNEIINHSGKCKRDILQSDIDKEFFKGLPPNFTYKSEAPLKIKSLFYCNENIADLKFEIDMRKSFFNIAYQIIDPTSVFPIFSSSEVYNKYDNSDIDDLYKYIISEKGMNRIKNLGFISNSINGLVINYLISINKLHKTNIKYFKKNTYTAKWSDILQRMDNILSENPNLPKDFMLYNGLLGRDRNISTIEIKNIQSSDEILFNHEGDEFTWKKTGWENEDNEQNNTDYTSFIMEKETFRYINTVSIYENIISNCNLFIIKSLMKIKELNPDAIFLKLRVDSLGFDREIKIPEEIKKYFKIVEKELIKNKTIHEPKIFDGDEIIKNILSEMDPLKQNKSFHGAPGTGKTYHVKKGNEYTYATTTTNVCSLNISTEEKESKTIYSLFGLYHPENIYKTFKKFKNSIIWIDEFSMIPKFVWNYITILSIQFNCKFIISGDNNQIPPIGEKKLCMNNVFFKNMMGDLKELKRDYRNDKKIIELRNYVLNEKESKIKQKFFNMENTDWVKYDRHICFTHKSKNIINEAILKDRGYKFEYINNSLNVSNGCLLSTRITRKNKNLYKNDIWEVISKNDNSYTLKNLLREKTIDFDFDLMKYFSLGFCTTAHSSQGLTIVEDLCIHEISMMIWADISILYTAITRAKKFSQLKFFNYKPIGETNLKLCRIDYDEDELEFQKFDEIKYYN